MPQRSTLVRAEELYHRIAWVTAQNFVDQRKSGLGIVPRRRKVFERKKLCICCAKGKGADIGMIKVQ